MLAVALEPGLWSSAPRSGLWQQRCRARWPDRGCDRDPGDIAHAQRGDRRSQLGVVAVTGIHQYDPLRQPRRAALICSRAICGLVWKAIASGTLALRRRS